jgi:uncharacterized protein (DUF58 family)
MQLAARVATVVRRLARVRTTSRGLALLIAAGGCVVLGVLLGLADIVALGAAGLLVLAVPWVWYAATRLDVGRTALSVTRALTPHPVVRGEVAAVRLVIAPVRPTAAASYRLAALRLSEQASHELAGDGGVRAKVAAGAGRTEVHYAIAPARRGRWSLGPVLSARSDLFGLVRIVEPLGGATAISVWPRTVDIDVQSANVGSLDQSGTGARLAGPDDAVLRDYVPGDDPRRVHWASAARSGHLMVRTEDAAGKRPVVVLLDGALLPHPALDSDDDWGTEVAASIACAFLAAGHPVRLVATSRFVEINPFVVGNHTGRAAVLDQAVDFAGHAGASEADRAMAASAEALRLARVPGEVVIAVLTAVTGAGIGAGRGAGFDALAAMATESGMCFAIVADDRPSVARAHADALHDVGWRVATVEPGTPPDAAWAALADFAAAERAS